MYDGFLEKSQTRGHRLTPAAAEAVDAFARARQELDKALASDAASCAMILLRYLGVQRAAAAVRLATGIGADIQHAAWEGRRHAE